MIVAPSGRVSSLLLIVARPVSNLVFTAFQLADAILRDLGAFPTTSPQLGEISPRYESQVFATFIKIRRVLKSQPCGDAPRL